MAWTTFLSSGLSRPPRNSTRRPRISSNPHKSGDDPETRLDCSFECARHLGLTSCATAMVHRHFEKAQPGLCSTHLHLEIPPVGLFIHAQLLEADAPDGPKRAHV